MRVVRPYHHFAGAAAADAMVGQRQQGVAHVRIAPVPGIEPPAEHRAVITFGIDHHRGVALGYELRLPCRQALVFEIGLRVPLPLPKLPDTPNARGWPPRRQM